MSFLERALRIGEGKQFKQFEKRVARVAVFEAELELESDDELRARINGFREQLGEADRKEHERILDEILPEVFAIVREAGKRTLGMRHFDVQLVGGMVLHAGSIAEMRTGEGKTLTATLPIVLNALTGLGVHLVTVNDYLARRDAEWMAPLYNFLGLSIGVLQNMQDYDTKRAAYAADITYGTNSEFGFDYLRDNMAQTLEERVRRGSAYAIVDEVDNILIDEARTPLIISGQPEQAADYYVKFAALAKTMVAGKKPEGMDPRQKKEFIADFDYEYEEKHKTVSVSEQGVAKA
ncbi:MAG: preprotein translocase subunit SecA, partial [Solirubrobacteraceae bacterium]|nr:preprotein translocase subunit SecA [Solirubrobacteraceae bacterium]